MFWSWVGPSGAERLVRSYRLGEVVEQYDRPLRLDAGAVADFVLGGVPSSATAFVGIHRVPAGFTATWTRPGADPELRRDEVAVDGGYLDVFDRSVDDLVVPGEPICAAMSGGLDSTFVVASLVRHAAAGRPVVAFAHVPHPDAGLEPVADWDPDDVDVARAMETAHPGRVSVVPVANLELRQPLDLVAEVVEQTWAPVLNPPNMVWIAEMRRRAVASGASVLFHGENGNSAFSYDHPYALRHALFEGDLAAARAVFGQYRATGMSPYRIARRYLAAPARAWLRARRHGPIPAPRPTTVDPFAAFPPVPPLSRQGFLDWLLRDNGLMGMMQPQPGLADLRDPFTTPEMLTVAATMPPQEWTRFGAGRAYARHLGAGRVPDEIRLRIRRGGQSWDHWFIVRHQRERYLDEIRSLPTTPVIGDLVPPDTVRRIEEAALAWPWGGIGPAPSSLLPVERLLANAVFVRTLNGRLAARR